MEVISDMNPFWQLSEIKKLTVRERKHWYARSMAKLEVQRNKSSQ